MKSPVFYKILSAVLALLLVLGSAYAAKLIHDAQFDVENFQQKQDAAQTELTAQTLELNKQKEFLRRMDTDPEFLEHVVRERLIYAKPEETIYRLDVDPLTGSSPGSNLEMLPQQLSKPPTGTSRSRNP
ncbi:MAG TPA: septum formation initiator family protein [Opitutales bacterium]|jgi:cell division protein FtsB|nr:septum formation initiator family protein [Opitutales bacterium]